MPRKPPPPKAAPPPQKGGKPAPPSKPPADNGTSQNKAAIPKRWRPERAPAPAAAVGRQGITRRAMRGPSRMSETAGRMLGLMSVMMGGRAAGMTTGQFSQNRQDVHTGVDGTVCKFFTLFAYCFKNIKAY